MADERVPDEQAHLFALEDGPIGSDSDDDRDLGRRVSEVRTKATRVRTTSRTSASRRTGADRAAADAAAEREVLVEQAGISEIVVEQLAAARVASVEAQPNTAEPVPGSLTPDSGTPDSLTPDSLTIAEFYDRVRSALAAEFTEEVWVTGEIRGIRESKGHRFLELADVGTPTARGIAPQLEVVCWARQWPRIARDLAAAGVDLEVGRVVRVRGQVSVWDGGSKLRFTLTALDVEALLGGIAAARRRLLLALEAEGLLEANRAHLLPPVPLRIGLVTSPGSEGQRDFVGQLERSGFNFVVHLAPSLVQGADAPGQLVAALRSLESFELDLAVVVRGGGARGDLACFDTEEVARAIATASFPVWTGIGHTGDRSVADEVAHHSCITPTACGEAIVNLVGEYWTGIERSSEHLERLARARLEVAAQLVERQRAALARGARHRLEIAAGRLSSGAGLLRRGADHRIARAHTENGRCAQVLRAYDPTRQLERGWSLTRDDAGRLVRSAAALAPGTRVTTRVAHGEFVSVVDLEHGSGR